MKRAPKPKPQPSRDSQDAAKALPSEQPAQARRTESPARSEGIRRAAERTRPRSDGPGEGELALHVIVVAPPPGYVFCVQGKAGEFLGARRSSTTDLVFDITVRATDDDPPRLLGNVAQGSPAERFLYVCTGSYAGELHALSGRRAKLPFATITKALVQRAKKGGRLVARIVGTAKDGGPACASVPLLDGGWRWQE